MRVARLTGKPMFFNSTAISLPIDESGIGAIG
jgi:hypothetical protein